MQIREVETLEDFDRALLDGLRNLSGWHLQSLDLTERATDLSRIDVAGGVFLGCTFVADGLPGSGSDLRRRGGLIFPRVPNVPVNPYRSTLYSANDLYAGLTSGGYNATPDAQAYAWSLGPNILSHTLAAALHDHSMHDALKEFTAGRDLVGVMGGHALRRDESDYRAAVHLGRALSSEFTVATGGGPGAMEAANLGAWLSAAPADAVDEALTLLAHAPRFTDTTAWAEAAFEVRRRWPAGAASLGVPTWFYGHEPPNALSTVIAKFFSNAIREDVLLKVCRGGLVFLPGAAGTVQEVFQTACANYYADASEVTPMILVGRDYWTEQLPVWHLLRTLADGRAFAPSLELVDSPEEVLPALVQCRSDRG